MFTGAKIDVINEPRILSSFFNDSFEKIFVDLHAMYAQANNTENVMLAQESANDSEILKIKSSIRKMKNDVRSYAFLINNPDFNEIKFNDFSDSRNFYSNRDAATIDPESQTLEIPPFQKIRTHQFIGDRETVVSVESLSDGFTVTSKDSSPENALNASKLKTWSETLLSDDPITTIYDGVVYDGAMSRVTVEFAQFEKINNIRLTPFAEYPISIVDMEYKNGDQWVKYPSFSNVGPRLGSFEFNSNPIDVNAIRFVILQETYTSNLYNIPKSAILTNLLWEQILDSKTTFDKTERELFPEDYGRSETEDGFAAYLDALNRYGFKIENRNTNNDEFNQYNVMSSIVESSIEVMGETEPESSDIILSAVTGKHQSPGEEYTQIQKAEYQYGLSYIEVNNIQYLPEASYESQRYVTQSTVYEVSLDASGTHVEVPNIENSGTHLESSIEWEVEVAENKKFPLLPSNRTIIRGELINVDRRTCVGNVRFATSDLNPVIRANGELLSPSKYTWTPSSKSVTILEFNRNIKYTIDYIPDSGQDTVDLAASNSIKIEVPETFDGTDDRGSVLLSYYPFIVYDIVNDSDKFIQHDSTSAVWTFRNSQGPLTIDGITYGDGYEMFYEPITVFVDGIKAFNITDYRKAEHPAFSISSSSAHQFEFIQIGRRIYLNQVIDKTRQIQVSYSYLAKYLKVNAKLRCNTIVEYPYTPSISEYQLNLKTANI
jgi:hypothetical protein